VDFPWLQDQVLLEHTLRAALGLADGAGAWGSRQHHGRETSNALQQNEGELELTVLRGSLLTYGCGDLREVRPCFRARKLFWSLAIGDRSGKIQSKPLHLVRESTGTKIKRYI